MLNIHQIINIRSNYSGYFTQLSNINRNSWIGICNEIINAMRIDDQDHDIIVDGDNIAIYRNGYIEPAFVYIGHGNFMCPMW